MQTQPLGYVLRDTGFHWWQPEPLFIPIFFPAPSGQIQEWDFSWVDLWEGSASRVVKPPGLKVTARYANAFSLMPIRTLGHPSPDPSALVLQKTLCTIHIRVSFWTQLHFEVCLSCQHLRTLVEQYRLCSECSKNLRCRGSQPGWWIFFLPCSVILRTSKDVYFKVCFYSLIILYNVFWSYPPLLSPDPPPPLFNPPSPLRAARVLTSMGSLQWSVINMSGVKPSVKADPGGKKPLAMISASVRGACELLHAWLLIGLILCRSYTGNHSCFEPSHVQKTVSLSAPSWPLYLTVFLSLFHDCQFWGDRWRRALTWLSSFYMRGRGFSL